MLDDPAVALTILVLALFVGFEVISKVPPLLHTPLMSGSNAISGITIVGALLAAGHEERTLSTVLGFIAVVVATINVVGYLDSLDEDLYSVPISDGTSVKLNGPIQLFGEVRPDYDTSADSSFVIYRSVEENTVTELYRAPIGGGTSTKLSLPLDGGTGVLEFCMAFDAAGRINPHVDSAVLLQGR